MSIENLKSFNKDVYPFKDIVEKWDKFWEKNPIKKRNGKKCYVLPMLPYPSGKLHEGHLRNYTATTIMALFLHIIGYSTVHYIGFDAFGLPAENAAIKNKINPKIWTQNNIESMRKDIKQMGLVFDWDYEIATCEPYYYKLQQEIFIEAYKKGLIYRKEDFINWDPIDECVLANEQINSDGTGWRSGALVIRKKLTQWFFKISQYSEKLLNNLDGLTNWPEKIITMQKNWIGKSSGSSISFKTDLIKSGFFEVFTTRPDTIYGCTFIVISPESDIANEINAGLSTEMIRTKESGKFVGYAIHPLTNEKIPVYFANYVIASYGTGVVMGVPDKDERDEKFAKEFNLKIINTDLATKNDLNNILSKLEQKTYYKLRDWCISRQRYWGCPIPVIYCEKCDIVLDENLPVNAPENVTFNGKKNPMETCEEWLYTKCPKCQSKAKRETDTMDTFVDSSWYFLAYPIAKKMKEMKLSAKELLNSKTCLDLMPVDIYVGGAEHAILHLIYARFFMYLLKDLNLIKTEIDEPFDTLITQGMLCSSTYQGKMTKDYYYPEEIYEANGQLFGLKEFHFIKEDLEFFANSIENFVAKKNSTESLEEMLIIMLKCYNTNDFQQKQTELKIIFRKNKENLLNKLKISSLNDNIFPLLELINNFLLENKFIKLEEIDQVFLERNRDRSIILFIQEIRNLKIIQHEGKFWKIIEEVEKGSPVKTSKSLKNAANLDNTLDIYGSEALKIFVVSDTPLVKDRNWDVDGIRGCKKFLDAIWRMQFKFTDLDIKNNEYNEKIEQEFDITFSRSIAEIYDSLNGFNRPDLISEEKFKLNIYTAALHKAFNAMSTYKITIKTQKLAYKEFLIALFPIASHISQECFFNLFNENVYDQDWKIKDFTENAASISVNFCINGKEKLKLICPSSIEENELLALAKEKLKIKNIINYIYIKKKILNIIEYI